MTKTFHRIQNAGLAVVLSATCYAGAPETVLFEDHFDGDASSAWTLQQPVDARGPIAPNGTWRAGKSEWVAEGTAAPWTVQIAGDEAWTDYRLSAKVAIRKPGPAPDFPICHAEYDRWLPRDWYPPLCAHPGQFRYRYYAGEFDWGSDAALWVRYRNRADGYRVQLSSIYQEMILWHGIGGYLAVVPCRVEPGRTYTLEVLAQGAHLQVLLDGERKIDYWHGCLPTLSGKIGVGAYHAAAAFSDVRVTALPPPGPTPAHQPRFNTRTWRTQRWVFDGDEPICLWEKDQTTPPGRSTAGMLSYFQVKLRPGYRPLYSTWVSLIPDYHGQHGCALAGTTTDIETSGENTERLVIRFDTSLPNGTMDVANTDTLTYDAVRGTYRHDMLSECSFRKDVTMTRMEFCDPLTYNNKEPGLSNRYRWLPAGHRWGVFLNKDGTVRRHPISQSLNIGAQNNWVANRGHSYWVLTPDRAVCPAWEHLMPGEATSLGVCHWGYDWHQYVWWQNKPRTFKTGEQFTVHYTMTGYPPAEGERLFLASSLHPKMEHPESAGVRRGSQRVPSLWAFPVVEPSGTSFDKLYDARVPYIGWQWYGDYDNDRQVGRTDRYSMRLDGPAAVNGMFYHHMIDSNVKRYLCTFWLKTQGLKDTAPVATLRYPWNEKVPRDVLDTGLAGDNDWTEFSVITTQPVISSNTSDATEFILDCKGAGTVWLDDWSVRPLADDEHPVEKRGTEAPVTAGPGPAAEAP